MIEWFMFGALGFFMGCLLGLLLAPPLWNRAVKLTTRRLEATMPMTLADIQADKDQLRADFAIQLRKVEVALEKSKEKAARELIEANKRRVEIQSLNSKLEAAKSEGQESDNANRVLQQTITRRLPDLDARLKVAKKALSDLESVNAELRNTVASQSEALKIARTTVHNQRADIDQLRLSLESGASRGRGSTKSDGRAVAENQRLAAELSRAQEELEQARTSTEEIEFLRRELNNLATYIIDAARPQTTSQFSSATPQSALAYQDAENTDQGEEHWPQDTGMEHPLTPAQEDLAAVQEALAQGNNGMGERAHFEPSELAAVVDGRPAYEPAAPMPALEDHDPHAPHADMAVDTSFARDVFEDENVGAENNYEPEEDYEPEEPFETYELEKAYDSSGDGDELGNDTNAVDYDDEPGDDDLIDDDANPGDGASEDSPDESTPQRSSLSKRFAARRAKRRADKAGGGSLTKRLRGLVADSPERRG